MKNNMVFLIVLIATSLLSLAQDSDNECIICMQDLYDGKNDVIILKCSAKDQKHQFHFKCIHEWQEINRKCPYCLSPLDSGSKDSRLYNYYVMTPPSDELRYCGKEIVDGSCTLVHDCTDFFRYLFSCGQNRNN